MRMLQLAVHNGTIRQLEAHVHPEVAAYLLNRKRREIFNLEELGKLTVTIHAKAGISPETVQVSCHDANGYDVVFGPAVAEPVVHRHGARPAIESRGGDRGNDRERTSAPREGERPSTRDEHSGPYGSATDSGDRGRPNDRRDDRGPRSSGGGSGGGSGSGERGQRGGRNTRGRRREG